MSLLDELKQVISEARAEERNLLGMSKNEYGKYRRLLAKGGIELLLKNPVNHLLKGYELDEKGYKLIVTAVPLKLKIKGAENKTQVTTDKDGDVVIIIAHSLGDGKIGNPQGSILIRDLIKGIKNYYKKFVKIRPLKAIVALPCNMNQVEEITSCEMPVLVYTSHGIIQDPRLADFDVETKGTELLSDTVEFHPSHYHQLFSSENFEDVRKSLFIIYRNKAADRMKVLVNKALISPLKEARAEFSKLYSQTGPMKDAAESAGYNQPNEEDEDTYDSGDFDEYAYQAAVEDDNEYFKDRSREIIDKLDKQLNKNWDRYAKTLEQEIITDAAKKVLPKSTKLVSKYAYRDQPLPDNAVEIIEKFNKGYISDVIEEFSLTDDPSDSELHYEEEWFGDFTIDISISGFVFATGNDIVWSDMDSNLRNIIEGSPSGSSRYNMDMYEEWDKRFEAFIEVIDLVLDAEKRLLDDADTFKSYNSKKFLGSELDHAAIERAASQRWNTGPIKIPHVSNKDIKKVHSYTPAGNLEIR